jgi:putative GTP pyrophosphokinase
MRFNDEEFEKLKRVQAIYEWALQTLLTKLNIIHKDLKEFQGKDTIDYIASRIKTPESIAAKLSTLGKELTAQNAKNCLFDIAGIRIICPFARDIYFLTDILRSMPNINILSEKDYVSSPKPSGYRSYHLIVEVPVFYSGKIENIIVEIQIRTEAMNFWATLEHKARYKYSEHIPAHLSDELVTISNKIAELDNRMFLIHEIISLINS